jgi:hypothetical protein
MSWGQGLAIFGSLLGAAGDLREGAAAKAAAEENARRTLYDAYNAENIFRKRFDRQQSTARTNIAKSGVTMSGTPLEVLTESASNAEIDALTSRYDAINQANSLKRQGKEAKKASYLRAGARLLSSFGQIA